MSRNHRKRKLPASSRPRSTKSSGAVEEKWPAAFKMVSNFTLTNEDENWAIFEVDNNGRDVKDVAKEWLAKNESLWRGWIKAAM